MSTAKDEKKVSPWKIFNQSRVDTNRWPSRIINIFVTTNKVKSYGREIFQSSKELWPIVHLWIRQLDGGSVLSSWHWPWKDRFRRLCRISFWEIPVSIFYVAATNRNHKPFTTLTATKFCLVFCCRKNYLSHIIQKLFVMEVANLDMESIKA